MSRDYKPRNTAAAPPRKVSPMLTGILVGYVLGLISALGLWWYISNAPSAFLKLEKPAENVAEKNAKPTTAKPADEKSAKPRFEFYKILPGSEEPVTEQQIKLAAKQPAPSAQSSQSAATNAGKEIYFIQVGSFQNVADADNLKAKLALMGSEATIQPADLQDKGLWHRVRLGPYSKIEELEKVRATLQLNGVQSSLIRVRENVPATGIPQR